MNGNASQRALSGPSSAAAPRPTSSQLATPPRKAPREATMTRLASHKEKRKLSLGWGNVGVARCVTTAFTPS